MSGLVDLVVVALALALATASPAFAQRNSDHPSGASKPQTGSAATQSALAGIARLGEPPESAPWKKVPQGGAAVYAVQGRFVAIGGEFGATTYACVACHGVDGSGDRSGAFPRIGNQSEWYLDRALQDFATAERPSDVMTPIASELTKRDRQNVAAFYAQAGAQPATPDIGPPHEEALEQGRMLATTGDPAHGILPCATCHGSEGQAAPPQYPYLAGQYEGYIKHQLELFQMDRRGGDQAKVMQPIAANLSPDQIESLARYFASLEPWRAESTPASEQAVSASEDASKPPRSGRQREPQSDASAAALSVKPYVGATIDPEPGRGDVVLPSQGEVTRR